MSRPRRVLIVSASAGNGHLRAGDALKRVCQTAHPEWQVEHLDVLMLAPRWVKAAYGGGFELLAARAPGVWGGLYRWADGPDGDHARWGAVVERVLFRAFRRVLGSSSWDLCLCTHFLPAQLAAGRAGLPPFALVVTDFTLHQYWAQPRVSQYYVATEALATGIRQRIPHAHVAVTGIPIDPGFGSILEITDARRQLALDPALPTAVLISGGLGIRIEESVAAVMRSGVENLQLIVVCGRNASARNRIDAMGLPARVRAIGYVEDVERYFAAADLVITKPGGLTTSEALAMRKPLLLTRPLPGNEHGNMCELIASGVALDASSPQRLTEAVSAAFKDTTLLQHMREMTERWARPNAAYDIAQSVSRQLHAEVAA